MSTLHLASCESASIWTAAIAVLLCSAPAAAQTPTPAPPVIVAPAAPPEPAPAAPVVGSPPVSDQAPPPVVEAAPGSLPPAVTPPTPNEPAAEEEGETSSWSDALTLSGYVEAYYSYNFAEPENGVTNNRWLDERHNSFTLQTAVLDVTAAKGPLSAKVTLMFGPTADRWYFEGARIPDAETGTVLSPSGYSNETWKHVQSAYAGYEAPIGQGLLIQGGLMPTQVGYEAAAVKDNWNWSRSNIFNFLPFFHVGARFTYPLTDWMTVSGALYNGWNQASDINKKKTFSMQTSVLRDQWLFNLLYLGGKERPDGDVAGQPWRNLFDAVVQYDVLPMLSLAANVDAGYERTDLGTDSWFAAGLYARVKATPWLYFAARGDGIYESVASRGEDTAAIFFGGGDHVLSGTFTAELRPIDGISFRLEYRHDDSDGGVPLYYKKGLDSDMNQRLSRVQNTLTVGMTGWF